MSIGQTIKKLRLEKGWTQEELGEQLGVKKAAVQKYESGQVQNLKYATVRRLCEVFETSPSNFLFDSRELQLSREVGLIEQIKRIYGKEVVELIGLFVGLDEVAQLKVIDYTSDLVALQSLRCEKSLN